MDIAYEYIIDTGGLDSESSYPYNGVSKRCRFLESGVGATMRNYQKVKKGDESDLQSAVAMQGPVAVAVDATHNTFRVSNHLHGHSGVILQQSSYKASQFLLLNCYLIAVVL